MIALVDDLNADSAALIQRAGYELPARFNVDLVHRRFLVIRRPLIARITCT